MSRREVAFLDDQCLDVSHDPQADPNAIQVRPMCFEWLRDEGYPIEAVRAVYSVVSVKDDVDSGYVAMEIDTLEYPLDVADAAKDAISIWVCSCPGFHYHRFPDLSAGERPSEVGECSHLEKIKRKERVVVESDEAQQRFDTPVGDK